MSPCQRVTLLLSFSASQNVATSQPGTGFLSACTWRWRTKGVKPCQNVGPGGWDCPMKISGHFIHFHLLKKPNISPVWHGPLSWWLPFEHSSAKMGSLDNDPMYSTMCFSITSTRSTSKFHPNTFQCSVWDVIMFDAITYGKDCTSLCGSNASCNELSIISCSDASLVGVVYCQIDLMCNVGWQVRCYHRKWR